MADRIAIPGELLNEFLVDDGDGRRVQCALGVRPWCLTTVGPHGVEVFRCALDPGGAFVQIRRHSAAGDLPAKSAQVIL
jgi:hypothetical protein